jgi:hypothetical protein
MMDNFLETILFNSAPVAAVTTAAVAVLRKRVPEIDGLWVLLAALFFALFIPYIIMWPSDVEGLKKLAQTAFFAWMLSVGGTSWAKDLLKR